MTDCAGCGHAHDFGCDCGCDLIPPPEKFTLEIRTVGAAFTERVASEEVADMLEGIVSTLRHGSLSNKTQSIFDVNGNRCGSWKLA